MSDARVKCKRKDLLLREIVKLRLENVSQTGGLVAPS